MMRHCLFAVAVVGLASMVGCGLIQSGRTTAGAHQPGAVTKVFDAPVNRVLVAAIDAGGPDFPFDFDGLAGFDFPIASVTSARGVKALNEGVVPERATFEAEVPLEEVNLGSGHIVGKAKDGRPVTLWLLQREQGKKTEANLIVGKHGDPDLSNAYLDRVADKLTHPTSRPKGESAMMMSFDEAIASALKKAAPPIDQGGPGL